MKSRFITFLILIIMLGFLPINISNASGLATKLKGKILLQVESAGQAWYVDPETEERAYLGRPDDAFRIMRELGLGISESSYNSFNGYAPSRLSGKILLRVEANGEAYYVNPDNLKLYYLGRPADAFQIMRELGLGISNANLNDISINQKYRDNDSGPQITSDDIDNILKNIENKLDEFAFQADSAPENLAGIIKKWENRIVRVNCKWYSSTNYSLQLEGYGSGFLSTASNGWSFINTNKHVVEYDGSIAQDCDIILPNTNETYNVYADFENMTMPDISFWSGFDFAQITIKNPSAITKVAGGEPGMGICKNGAEIGDDVVILGFPTIGSTESITATEGIISGIETGRYVTSAKIDSGNSGGAAILLKDDCYLGIPTYTNIGSAESLGRILDIAYTMNTY